MNDKRKIFILSSLALLNSFPVAYGGEVVIRTSSKNINVAKVAKGSERTDNLSLSLNSSSQKKTIYSTASESIQRNQSDTNELTKTSSRNKTWLKVLTAVLGLGLVVPRVIAHEMLLLGDSLLGHSFAKPEYYGNFNLYRAKKKIQIKDILSKRLGLKLCGYELNCCDGPVKNICILFHGNGDDSRFDISSICGHTSTKNTIFVSFEYPARRYFRVHETLWWMNEEDFKKYADDVYDFVKHTYIDGKNDNEKPRIIARGWSLGGYPASYLASKDDVSCVILDSPVSLASVFGLMTRPLFGFHLNSIKNILNVTRTKPLDLVMRSGGDNDFLSLDKTISYELGKKFTTQDELKNELNQRLKGKNVNLKKFKICECGNHIYYGSSWGVGNYISKHYK